MMIFSALSLITSLLLVLIALLIFVLIFIIKKKGISSSSFSKKSVIFSNSKYQDLIQNAADIIFETDSAGNFVSANDFTLQHMGYEKEEVIGQSFLNFVEKSHRERLAILYKDLIVQKNDFPSIEIPIVKKDGTLIWVLQKVIIHRNRQAKIVGFSGISRDITALKNYEFNEKQRLVKIEKYNRTVNHLSNSNFSNFENFNDVLHLILKQTAVATETNVVSYWNYQHEELKSQTSYNLNKDEIIFKAIDPSQFLAINFELLKQKKSISIPNVKADTSGFLMSTDQLHPDINSMLVMSVFHNGSITGVLCLANREKNYDWDNEDTNFIRTVIDFISLGLELQLRLETERLLKYRSQVWAIVSKVTQQFLLSKNPFEIFTEIFPPIGKATNVDHIYYYENDTETQTIKQKYKWARDKIELQISTLRSFTYEEFKEISNAAKQKKPFSSLTKSLGNGAFKQLLIENEIKSIAIWPLFVYNEFSGFIGFDSCTDERIWTEDEINIFQVLANNISSVIERINNENIAKKSEERFRLLANNIPGTVYLAKFDEKWTKIYLNDEIEKLTGYTKSVFIDGDKSFSDLIHEDDRTEVMEFAREKILAGEPLHNTYRIIRKDNTIAWVEEFADVIWNEDKIEYIEGLFIDITEKREAESAIIDKDIAQAANKAKSEFLANMSHEIKTPLNGIIGFTDLLMQTPLDGQQQSFMKTVHHSATTLLGIISDILDFSKIEAGKLELDLQPVALAELLESIRHVIRFDLERKNLTLEISIQNEIPKTLLLDAVRVKQILLNLVSNAIKFTEKGKITILIESKEQINSHTQKIRFSVIDTGIGILPVNQKKIFEPFSQEDNSITRKYGGTGLGLTITNQLLQLMESKLKVKSKPEKGSTFYFDLIATEKIAVAYEISSVDKTVLEYDTSGLKFKILIAEDNSVNMLLIKTILKNLFPKAELVESYNGLEAVAKFHECKPDIILMDIQMPMLNGVEATQQIRASEKEMNVPIIALTAGTMKEERDLCFASGMNDFVSKPVVKDTIKEVILKWRNNLEIR